MSQLSPRSAQLARQGFQQLDNSYTIMPPRDQGASIPLEAVVSHAPNSAAAAPPSAPTAATSSSVVNEAVNGEKSGLFSRHHGRRKAVVGRKLEDSKSIAEDDSDTTLNQLGRFYNRILNFSIVVRYFLYVLPLGLAIAAPIVVGATAAPNARVGDVSIVWLFTWIELGELFSPHHNCDMDLRY